MFEKIKTPFRFILAHLGVAAAVFVIFLLVAAFTPAAWLEKYTFLKKPGFNA